MWLLSRLADQIYRLFGTKRLTALEDLCIHAWRDSLPERERGILDVQLQSAAFVQRGAAGAKLCLYYGSNTQAPMFCNKAPEAHVATVLFRSADPTNPKRMPARIYLVNGRFFSVEFPKRPWRYALLNRMIEPLQVAEVITEQPVGDSTER